MVIIDIKSYLYIVYIGLNILLVNKTYNLYIMYTLSYLTKTLILYITLLDIIS